MPRARLRRIFTAGNVDSEEGRLRPSPGGHASSQTVTAHYGNPVWSSTVVIQGPPLSASFPFSIKAFWPLRSSLAPPPEVGGDREKR